MSSGKSRKLRLTCMQREILRMLESGGAEFFLTVISILRSMYSDVEREVFIADAEVAIQGLVRLGFVALYRSGENAPMPAEESDWLLAISARLQWHETAETWLWAQEQYNTASIERVLTDEGKRAVRGLPL